MKLHLMLGLPCIVLPFAFAVGLSLWAARESGAFASQLGLAALPCGLLGLSAGLILALIGFYGRRIGQLERRLEQQSQDESQR